MDNRQTINLANDEQGRSKVVTLKWSDILESAFDYYYSEYMPAWTLNQTRLNNSGDKLFISKKSTEWVSWEKINKPDRPDIATLFDLLPDLPEDENFWKLIKKLENEGIKDPEDHFWENIFSYEAAKEISVNEKKYHIEWEA
ncbi:MAG: hypothetical protein RIG61_08805 [Deltaproteobacteria bacterium]